MEHAQRTGISSHPGLRADRKKRAGTPEEVKRRAIPLLQIDGPVLWA
jgi:hypothetical protein